MNAAFIDLLERNLRHADEYESRFDGLQDGQAPDVVTVCCSDSRVLQDHMWGNDDPGTVFTCGNIGNRVTQHTDDGPVVSGDLLYPIVHTDTRTAVVVGHTGCGAVTAAHDDLTEGRSEPPGIAACLDLLEGHLADGIDRLPAGLDREERINRLVEYNVDRQIDALLESDHVPDDLTAIGVVYDFQDVYGGRRGEVSVINVDGETDVSILQETHSEIAQRIDRLWEP
ncbi:carbonic anhydrase [Halopenitus sp. H-Gu1]|uniref:carbonic anhydrase n=1 Tax=Halopenitus sp. H-Gu1 TaxID=3242697 RepID=UPI00359E2E60